MRVRMTQYVASGLGNFNVGQEVELDDEVAERWVTAGYAVQVNAPERPAKAAGPAAKTRPRGPKEER